MPTGLGNHYGTFTGAINHFSNQTKPQEIKKEKPNVITNPTKKVKLFNSDVDKILTK